MIKNEENKKDNSPFYSHSSSAHRDSNNMTSSKGGGFGLCLLSVFALLLVFSMPVKASNFEFTEVIEGMASDVPIEGEEEPAEDGEEEKSIFYTLTEEQFQELLSIREAGEEEPAELSEEIAIDSFLESPVQVDRYQYEIIKRFEFLQYAAAIVIGLLFIAIFRAK